MYFGSLFDEDGPTTNLIATLHFSTDKWDLYSKGYKTAADTLVLKLLEDQRARSDIDTLVYPVLFLYRQYLELRLKQLIIKLGRFLGDQQSFPRTHRIDHLWRDLKPLMEKADEEFGSAGEVGELFSEINDCIQRYAALDPKSEAFRYPVDNKDNPSLATEKHINVAELAFIVNGVGSALDGASIQIDVWQDMLSDAHSATPDEWMFSPDFPERPDDNDLPF